MDNESCPVCETPVPVDRDGTFVTCPSCSVPFVRRAAERLELVVRDDFGPPSADGIQLTEEFRERYQLGRLLGAGAIGMVCEAVHKHSRRPVAVKFLKRIVDPSLKERFLQEGRLLARVQHPNVLKIFELSDLDGFPYLVTELMTGGTLKQRIARDGKMAPAAAVALMGKCLDGLQACHQAGFIHRDLKPENILMSAEGEPTIADLGIARVLEAHGQMTAPGSVMGTPRYMSPEQGRGETVGIATDIYAMGAVLYEMLSGEAPFNHPDLAELIRLQIEVLPPLLSEKVPDLPEGLSDVVHRALAKQAADRPLSAASFKDALVRTVVRRSSRTAARSGRAMRVRVSSGFMPRLDEATVSAERSRLFDRERPTAGIGLAIGFGALLMAAAALVSIRAGARPAPVAVRSVDPAEESAWSVLARRTAGLRERRERAAEQVMRLRADIEDNRFQKIDAELVEALARSEVDLSDTRQLLGDVGQALAQSRDPHDLDLARALTLHWLALARDRWLKQKKYMLAQSAQLKGSADWQGMLSAGPEAATAEMLPVLRRWHGAVERLLRKPASMPSTAGPELAELLADVHAVSLATHTLEWHRAAVRQLDHDTKSFMSNLGHLEGMTARLLERIVSDLWRWGHAEGAFLSGTAGLLFAETREGTIEQLRALSSFLAPAARAAIRDLMVEAQAGFKRPGRRTAR